jgi:hypothetical protein
VGFALRLLLHSAAIVVLATGCAYPYYSYPYGYYPYGYGYYPYGYSGYGPTVVGTEADDLSGASHPARSRVSAREVRALWRRRESALAVGTGARVTSASIAYAG